MEKEIKDLRIKIDGLAQLVKDLGVITKIDMKNIPDGLSPEEYIERIKLSKEDISGTVMKLTSKEINKSHDSLILAKAWLGKVLSELGSENPYKGGYKTKEDIEPTADTYKVKSKSFNTTDDVKVEYPEYSHFLLMNHIEKVDWLRTEIENIIKSSTDFNANTDKDIYLEQSFAYKYLYEAKFWLGFELQRIKESN